MAFPRLSTIPLIRDADPETAAALSTLFAQILEDEEVQGILAEAGVNPASLLDTALTPQGIFVEQEQRRRATDPLTGLSGAGLFGSAQKGAADFLQSFGIPQALGFEASEPSLPSQVSTIGPVEADLTRFLTTVGASLIPYIGATRGASLLTKGVTNPYMRGALTTGPAFGAVETARQIGRRLGAGEEISIPQIVSETLIGGVSGLPLGSGISGRLMQAAATGGAAAATSALPGVEFSHTRVGTEALFAALFPTRRTPTPDGVPIDQRGVLLRAAEEYAAAPALEIRKAIESKLGGASQEALERAVREGALDEEIIADMLSRGVRPENKLSVEELDDMARGLRPAPTLQDNLASRYLNARAASVEALSALPDDVLEEFSKRGGAEAQFAADALAYKKRAVRPPEAPGDDPLDPKEYTYIQDPARDLPAAEAAVANEALAVIRARTLPMKAARARVKIMGEAAVPPPTPIRPDIDSMLREHLFPETEARLKDMDARRGALEDKLVEARTTNDRVEAQRLSQELRKLTRERNAVADSVVETLDVTVPVKFNNVEEAKTALEALSTHLSFNQLADLKKNLPLSMQPYEKELQTYIQKTLRKRFRQHDAIGRRLINEERRLRKERVLLDPSKDVPPDELRQLEGGDTFRGMSTRAKALGGTLEASSGGYLLKRGGQSIRLNGLRQVKEVLDTIAQDVPTNILSLDAAAARRLMSVQHVGDGAFRTVDHLTGETADHASAKEAGEHIASVPPRDAGAPDLTPHLPVALPDNATGRQAMARPGGPVSPFFDEAGKLRSPRKVSKDIVENIRANPLRLQGLLTTAKEAMQEIESRISDVPVYSELFEPMAGRLVQRANFLDPHIRALKRAFKGTTGDRMNAIQEVFLARGPSREVMAQLHNLNGKERQSVEALERWYGNLFELNPEGVRELQTAMSDYRKAGGDPRRALGKFMTPRVFNEIQTGIQEGKLRPGAERADEVAISILHELANERHGINELSKRGYQMLRLLHDRTSSIGKLSAASPEGRAHDIAASVLARYLDQTVDRSDLAAQGLKDVWSTILSPYLKKMGSFLSSDERAFVKGDMLSKQDLDRIASMFTSWYSGIAMSARTALVTRNLVQAMMDAPKIGLDNSIKALSYTVRNWDESVRAATEAGVVSPNSAMLSWSDIGQQASIVPRTGRGVGKISALPRTAASAMNLGLVPYKWTDQFNRVKSFVAGRDVVRRYGERFLKDDNLPRFLLDTGAAGDSDVVQRILLSKLRNQGIEAAATFYGRHLADDTQFIYSRNNLPEWMTGTAGKLIGQFGVWPVSWWNYMRRNSSGFNSGGTRQAYARKFVARYAIQTTALMAAGWALGINTQSWNVGMPHVYEGGPALQLLGDTYNSFFGPSDFQRDIAKANLRRAAAEIPIPFGGLMRDFRQAAEGETGYRKFMEALGFSLRKTGINRLPGDRAEALMDEVLE